ncbi:helix-turn-helix domain-containing protein [Roseovarius sp.]|uniref:helix-turn-helix domain-containing protein n=1 Tax=Roseovarius sp. TaxID=1486281 RepID=UPI003A97DD4C
MPKQARLNGIKSFRCYTIEEAAEVSGVSPRTVRNWASDGLRVMDDTRPALIRGDDLRDHIKTKRESRSTKTKIDTFYCFCCRKERAAAEGMADCEIKDGRAKLTALCETCATVVSKPVAEALITQIALTLDLKITRH